MPRALRSPVASKATHRAAKCFGSKRGRVRQLVGWLAKRNPPMLQAGGGLRFRFIRPTNLLKVQENDAGSDGIGDYQQCGHAESGSLLGRCVLGQISK